LKDATDAGKNRTWASATPLDERLKSVTVANEDQGPMPVFLTSTSGCNPSLLGSGREVQELEKALGKTCFGKLRPRTQVAPRYVKMCVVNGPEKIACWACGYGVHRIRSLVRLTMAPAFVVADQGSYLGLASANSSDFMWCGRDSWSPAADCRHGGSTVRPPCQQRGGGRSEWKAVRSREMSGRGQRREI
jgi:hypothetical protein